MIICCADGLDEQALFPLMPDVVIAPFGGVNLDSFVYNP